MIQTDNRRKPMHRLTPWIILLSILIQGKAFAVEISTDAYLLELNQHFIELPQPINDAPDIELLLHIDSLSSYRVHFGLNLLGNERPELSIKRTPLVNLPSSRNPAKALIIAEQLGLQNNFLNEVFATIHEDEQILMTREDFVEHIEALSSDKERFLSAFISPTVNEQVQKLKDFQRKLPVKGAPSIIIRGRWLIDASMVSSTRELLEVIRYLLDTPALPRS